MYFFIVILFIETLLSFAFNLIHCYTANIIKEKDKDCTYFRKE